MKKSKKVKSPTFVPFGPRCLVQRRKTKTKSAGGIILPGEAQELPEGMVIAVGEKCVEVKTGDYVIFGGFSGHEVTSDGIECLVVMEEEIVGRFMGVKLEKEEEEESISTPPTYGVI